MFEVTTEHDRTLAYVAYLYGEGFQNQEIAAQLNISKALVTDLVAEARDRGVIQRLINLSQDTLLASRLVSLFAPEIPSPRAIVVPVPPRQKANVLRVIGVGAKNYFESIVRDGNRIAADGGHTVARVIEGLQPWRFKNIELYPIAGGPLDDSYVSVASLIGRFLGKYGEDNLTHYSFPPPTTRVEQKLALDVETQQTIQEASQARVMLLGIGAISSRGGTTTITNILNTLNIKQAGLIKKRIVGVIGYSAFDAKGRGISSALDSKVYKVSGEQIQQAARNEKQQVIIVGGGTEKVHAIKAAIQGGWGNCIITDEYTAKSVISLSS